MAPSVHGYCLFDIGLLERWRQPITANSGPVTRLAELVAEYQVKSALRALLFPCAQSQNQLGWNRNLADAFAGLEVKPAVSVLRYLALHSCRRNRALNLDHATVKVNVGPPDRHNFADSRPGKNRKHDGHSIKAGKCRQDKKSCVQWDMFLWRGPTSFGLAIVLALTYSTR